MENRVCEALQLTTIKMRVCAQNTTGARILLVENIDLSLFVAPGIEYLTQCAAMLAPDLEPLEPIHTDCNRKVKMTQRPVFELGVHKPGKCSEALQVTCANSRNGTTQEPGQVYEMAAMCEHVILLQVRFWIALGLDDPRSLTGHRL